MTGLVLRRDGQPAAAAGVRVILDAADPERKTSPMVVADRNGRFTMRGLAAGPLTLVAARQDEAAVVGPEPLHTADRKEVTIRLGPSASVAGVVRWDDGTAIERGAVVTAQSFCQGDPFARGSELDLDGRFTIWDLPPGEISLQVHPHLEGPVRSGAKVTLRPGEQRTGVDLVVARR